MTAGDYEQYENTASMVTKINDLRLRNVELAQRVDELNDNLMTVEARQVAMMQLIEMLAARLGELVPEAAVTKEDLPDAGEPGAYL